MRTEVRRDIIHSRFEHEGKKNDSNNDFPTKITEFAWAITAVSVFQSLMPLVPFVGHHTTARVSMLHFFSNDCATSCWRTRVQNRV